MTTVCVEKKKKNENFILLFDGVQCTCLKYLVYALIRR